MTAYINDRIVGHPSSLSDIESLYDRLAEGEAITIFDTAGIEIERHIMLGGKVVSQECGVDYDSDSQQRECKHCGKVGLVAADETDPDLDDDFLALDTKGEVEPNYYVCGECYAASRA